MRAAWPVLVVAAVVSLPLQALADGCVLPGSSVAPVESAQTAIIIHWPGYQAIIFQPRYSGPPADAVWLIPVPAAVKKADVEIADERFVSWLLEWTSPTCVTATEPLPKNVRGPVPPGAPSAMGGPGYKGYERPAVTAQVFHLGPFEVALLESVSERALAGWLKQHGYKMPRGADRFIKPYAERGWKLVAVRLGPGKESAAANRPDAAETDLPPLAVRFPCTDGRPVYPLYISRASARQWTVLDLLVLGPGPAECEEIEAVVPDGFEARSPTVFHALAELTDLWTKAAIVWRDTEIPAPPDAKLNFAVPGDDAHKNRTIDIPWFWYTKRDLKARAMGHGVSYNFPPLRIEQAWATRFVMRLLRSRLVDLHFRFRPAPPAAEIDDWRVHMVAVRLAPAMPDDAQKRARQGLAAMREIDKKLGVLASQSGSAQGPPDAGGTSGGLLVPERGAKGTLGSLQRPGVSGQSTAKRGVSPAYMIALWLFLVLLIAGAAAVFLKLRAITSALLVALAVLVVASAAWSGMFWVHGTSGAQLGVIGYIGGAMGAFHALKGAWPVRIEDLTGTTPPGKGLDSSGNLVDLKVPKAAWQAPLKRLVEDPWTQRRDTWVVDLMAPGHVASLAFKVRLERKPPAWWVASKKPAREEGTLPVVAGLPLTKPGGLQTVVANFRGAMVPVYLRPGAAAEFANESTLKQRFAYCTAPASGGGWVALVPNGASGWLVPYEREERKTLTDEDNWCVPVLVSGGATKALSEPLRGRPKAIVDLGGGRYLAAVTPPAARPRRSERRFVLGIELMDRSTAVEDCRFYLIEHGKKPRRVAEVRRVTNVLPVGDGRRVFVSTGRAVLVLDVATGQTRQVLGNVHSPLLAVADGRAIVRQWVRNPKVAGLVWLDLVDVDAAGQVRRLWRPKEWVTVYSVLRDGKRLWMVTALEGIGGVGPDGKMRLQYLDLSKEEAGEPVTVAELKVGTVRQAPVSALAAAPRAVMGTKVLWVVPVQSLYTQMNCLVCAVKPQAPRVVGLLPDWCVLGEKPRRIGDELVSAVRDFRHARFRLKAAGIWPLSELRDGMALLVDKDDRPVLSAAVVGSGEWSHRASVGKFEPPIQAAMVRVFEAPGEKVVYVGWHRYSFKPGEPVEIDVNQPKMGMAFKVLGPVTPRRAGRR